MPQPRTGRSNGRGAKSISSPTGSQGKARSNKRTYATPPARRTGILRIDFFRKYIKVGVFTLVFAAIGAFLLSFGHAASSWGLISLTYQGKQWCLDNKEDNTVVGYPQNQGAVNGNKVQVEPCNGSPSQQWRYTADDTVQNINGYCLSEPTDATSGSLNHLWQCNGSSEQQWSIDNSKHSVTNPSTKLCLDVGRLVNSYPVKVYECNSAPTQQWNVAVLDPKPKVLVCSKAQGPFTVGGTTVLRANGDQFVPTGITLSTPQYWPYTYGENPPEANSDTTLSETERQIHAIATNWCGNTVRLQIEQDTLVGTDGKSNNGAYMDYIKQVVAYAESLKLVVVLNAQTEHSLNTPGGLAREPMPTKNTEAFWHIMDKSYARDPQVIYDLFNEPEFGNTPASWNDWRNGFGPYVGMQGLANYVRTDGSKNVFWIEGLDWGENLSEVASNPTAYAVRGAGPIVYAIHNPDTAYGINSSGWDETFGNIKKKNIGAIVVGEFTNEADDGGNSCWPDAPQQIPEFLTYLKGMHVGLTAWTLGWQGNGEGALNNNAPEANTNGNLADAKGYSSAYSCSSSNNQGAGHDLQSWFYQLNSTWVEP